MTPPHRKLLPFVRRSPEEGVERVSVFRDAIARRRTVRDFSSEPVPQTIIRDAIMAAATAPSGANQQPWTFVAVADQEMKSRIRRAAEEEERAFYSVRATPEWLEALAAIGTDADKPFLEIAPWLIVVFGQRYGVKPSGERIKHYYVPESVGIACGFLIAALHDAGLATLTHTPSPMGFLSEICGRPDNEKPVLLVVAGYPAEGATVPNIGRKEEDEVIVWRT